MEAELEALVAEHMSSFNDASHDFDHVLRVRDTALGIAADTPGDVDLQMVRCAALAHDVLDHKFSHDNNVETRLRTILFGIGGAEWSARVIRIITGISWSSRHSNRHNRTLEMDIVQDADRLDAIGPIGVARAFHFGGVRGHRLDQTLGHFREKLLLIKDDMRTPSGRARAEPLHGFLVQFVAGLPIRSSLRWKEGGDLKDDRTDEGGNKAISE